MPQLYDQPGKGRRPCPQCGKFVHGRTGTCPGCGYVFPPAGQSKRKKPRKKPAKPSPAPGEPQAGHYYVLRGQEGVWEYIPYDDDPGFSSALHEFCGVNEATIEREATEAEFDQWCEETWEEYERQSRAVDEQMKKDEREEQAAKPSTPPAEPSPAPAEPVSPVETPEPQDEPDAPRVDAQLGIRLAFAMRRLNQDDLASLLYEICDPLDLAKCVAYRKEREALIEFLVPLLEQNAADRGLAYLANAQLI